MNKLKKTSIPVSIALKLSEAVIYFKIFGLYVGTRERTKTDFRMKLQKQNHICT